MYGTSYFRRFRSFQIEFLNIQFLVFLNFLELFDLKYNEISKWGQLQNIVSEMHQFENFKDRNLSNNKRKIISAGDFFKIELTIIWGINDISNRLLIICLNISKISTSFIQRRLRGLNSKFTFVYILKSWWKKAEFTFP